MTAVQRFWRRHRYLVLPMVVGAALAVLIQLAYQDLKEQCGRSGASTTDLQST